MYNLYHQDKGDIYSHHVQLTSEQYTPKDDVSIPTGEIASVADTPFDLRAAVNIDENRLALINNQVHVLFLLNFRPAYNDCYSLYFMLG